MQLMLYQAPDVQEYFDKDGNVKKFIGALVPLCITPEILDFEFIGFMGTNNADGRSNSYLLTELTSRGGAITNDDIIKALSSNKIGRTILAK